MNRVYGLVLILVSASALAGGEYSDPHQAAQTAHANANQAQVAIGKASASVASSNVATNEGNAVSISERDRLQAPAIAAPAIYASNSCAAGWSAGASVPGFGVSGGRAKPDPNCDRREVARILMGVNPALALKVLCADPYVREVATEADCVYAVPAKVEAAAPIPAAPAVVADPKYVTQEQLDRAFKQSIAK